MYRSVLAVAMLIGVVADAQAATPQSAILSNDQTFRVAVSFEPRLGYGAELTAKVRISCARGASCAHSGLSFGAIMPQHGHGLSYAPQVERVGDNEYLVRGIRFHMPGYWQVHFDVLTEAGMERAQFDADL